MDVVLNLLFGTDIGLLSMATIGGVLVIGIVMVVMFMKKSGDPNA